MKNIFKFMGVALVAGCLVFAACKKDDNDSEGTTPTPQPQQSSYSITFDGQVQNLTVSEAKNYDAAAAFQIDQVGGSLNILYHVAAAGINGTQYVAPVFTTAVAKVANIPAQYGIADGCYLPEQILQGCDYGNEILDQYEMSWSPANLNADPTYGTFDATANTFSCTINLSMYNYDEFYTALMEILAANGITTEEDLEQVDDATYKEWADQAYDEASKADYIANLSNIVFTPATYSK